ncbi:MAG: methylated-DNA--[protein]-cysteine S-methyltransferase [Gammaproteobacteria bacterium]|nr:methylated-DNA--[protein]-cysteine S-methyltransferase [Gammaproteobacteria bacterium]
MAKSKRNQQIRIPSNKEMHAAIDNRNEAYDGAFFYGVITTGVVCKPSCASRPARPKNIRFFLDLDSARQAGFRPCKRCRPENLGKELEKIVEIARYIESKADDHITLTELSKMANLSPSRFQKVFKSILGVSPKEYQDASRLDKYKSALKKGKTVTEAIYFAGYGSPSRVYGEAARNMGMTPAAYRAEAAGERIYFAYRNSFLGPLLMAATERGVCFAQFGDNLEQLKDQLKAEFPKAQFLESPGSKGPELDLWIKALDDHIGRNSPCPDLPLDIRGTSFQLKVWRFLLSVKEGDVLSYGELAKEIDKPSAFRAVASACGANKVGVLIPCHRVLRANGDIGVYRWCIERKLVLLEKELAGRST